MPRRGVNGTILTPEGNLVEVKKLTAVGPGPTYYLAIPKDWLELWAEPVGGAFWVEWEFHENTLTVKPLNAEKAKLLIQVLEQRG